MVKTSRVVLLKDLRYLIPSIVGLIVLIYLSVLAATYITRQQENKIREILSRRDSLVLEYDSYQDEFSSLLTESLSLTVQEIPVDYSYTLARLENDNLIMLSLSEDIRNSSAKAKADTLMVDEARLKNHQKYKELIRSLKTYKNYTSAEMKIRNCYDGINLQKNDQLIVSSIDKCDAELKLLNGTYPSYPADIKNYWANYLGYWGIVKSIHSIKDKAMIPALQKDLKSAYNSIDKSYTNYVNALESFYKGNLLGQIKQTN